MNRASWIRGAVALFTLTAWFLVYGAYFFETVFPYHNVIEPSDESVERALSLDVGQTGDVPDVAPKSIQLANAGEADNIQASIGRFESTVCRHRTFPCAIKLFKLLSIYRL